MTEPERLIELAAAVKTYQRVSEEHEQSFMALEAERTKHSDLTCRLDSLQQRIDQLVGELKESAPLGSHWKPDGPMGPGEMLRQLQRGSVSVERLKR